MVYLKIDGSRLYKGQVLELVHVVEQEIDCEIRDPMAMTDPISGNAIGDAVFDAAPTETVTPDIIGDDATGIVIGYEGGIPTIIGPSNDIYALADVDNYCDAKTEDYVCADLTTEDGLDILTENGMVLVSECLLR